MKTRQSVCSSLLIKSTPVESTVMADQYLSHVSVRRRFLCLRPARRSFGGVREFTASSCCLCHPRCLMILRSSRCAVQVRHLRPGGVSQLHINPSAVSLYSSETRWFYSNKLMNSAVWNGTPPTLFDMLERLRGLFGGTRLLHSKRNIDVCSVSALQPPTQTSSDHLLSLASSSSPQTSCPGIKPSCCGAPEAS